MHAKHFVALLLVSSLAASQSTAQNFDYPNFNAATGLSLNVAATTTGGVLRVTPATASARGSVYRTAPVNVAAGFDTTFQFRISATGLGADGMAFVIHNDPRGVAAIGGDGSTMSYGNQAGFTPIANSLVIELDTYDAGTPWFDPNDNHLSIQTNGTGDNNAFHSLSIGSGIPSVDLNAGGIHKLRVVYTPGSLQVFFDGGATPLISTNYNFGTGGTWTAGGAVGGLNLIGGTNAYVGFSAACGGLTENHDVLSWSWIGLAAPPVVYCTSGTSTNGCAASISASAQPSASAASACTISLTNVEGQKSGLVFYGINNTGFTPLSWGAGSSSFLCVKSPTQRTPAQGSGGGTGLCNGVINLNWNGFQAAFPGSLGQPWATGVKVYAQGWYRDPPAVKTTNLSDAIELTTIP